MLEYFRRLPSQPLAVRRRFVVLATTSSFAVIVLVWTLLVVLGRESPPRIPAAPTPETLEATIPRGASEASGPGADIDEVSADLERFFGSPSPPVAP